MTRKSSGRKLYSRYIFRLVEVGLSLVIHVFLYKGFLKSISYFLILLIFAGICYKSCALLNLFRTVQIYVVVERSLARKCAS